MKLFLLAIAILMAAWLYFMGRACISANNRHNGSRWGFKIAFIFKNQEPWIEGFMRKLFRCITDMPPADVLVVDDFSYDHTRAVLSRLQRDYPFDLLTGRAENYVRTPSGIAEDASGFPGFLCFDVRGLKGKELLNAPLFWRLHRLCKGKYQVLSK